MTSVSNNFLRLAVLAACVGISLGYVMGASQNFTAAPVHAHINLLGWVSMFLYGLFYRAHPTATAGWLPATHFWINLAGFLIFMPALAVEILAPTSSMAAAAGIGLMVGPTLVLVSMLLFAVIVFRATGKKA